jgi:hypothetical protein
MDWIKVIFWLLVVIALVIAGPLLVIWSLNTMFPMLAIPYSIETWAAALILGGVFKSNVKVSK